MFDNALQALARVHAVDWEFLGLADTLGADPSKSGAPEQLAALKRQYDWVRVAGQSSPTIDAAFELLGERLPADEQLTLNWGDARIGDVIFDPESVQVCALLDWEMATIASPEMDFGWFIFFSRIFTDGYGCEPLSGFRGRGELIAAGAVPADSLMPISHPGSITLAKILELPLPEGASADFMASR